MESKVLLVEDDPLFVRAMQKIARNRFHLDVATNGADGFRMFSEANVPYDSILLDVHLPDYRGDEIAIMIRRRRLQQEILFATGDKEPGTLEALLESGCANGFLQKGAFLQRLNEWRGWCG